MSLLVFFHWLARTHIGIAMRDSTWGFAIVEIVHLIALAIFGGAILFVDSRLIGIRFTAQPAPLVARELLPVTVGGVAVLFVTGSLLLASGPMRYCYNTPFRIKMWLFFIALIFHFVLQVKVAQRDPEDDRSGLGLRAAGAFSLFLWASIGIAGRAIGYF
jgi:hypothetical protein